jgi:hypothetical protein
MQALQKNELRRDRRVYTLKSDREIIRKFADFQYLTNAQMAELTGRKESRMRERLRNLHLAGILNRVTSAAESSVPYISPQPYVYFLDVKGGELAYELGYLPAPRGTESKSRLMIGHDLEITKFHISLHNALQGQPYEWKQWRGELKDTIEIDGERQALIPDAYFSFQNQCFFLEIVKSKETEYVNGESNIERKFKTYLAYQESFKEKYGYDDFRVIWVFPTKERVVRILSKLENELPYRKFWLTDEESYQTNISGRIFWTPKDFRDATYGLFP